jgi:hypothetical protein
MRMGSTNASSKDLVECSAARSSPTYNNTTANFKNHLALVHPAISKELEDTKEELAKKARFAPPPLSPDQPRLADFFDPIKTNERVRANKLLVRALEKDTVHFIAADLRPFSAVEGTPRSSLS